MNNCDLNAGSSQISIIDITYGNDRRSRKERLSRMKTLTRNAYAKVNLALDVLRRREDGYHDVCMIMQNLSLYDTLTFTMKEADTLAITLSCDKEFVPCDEKNLVYKAVALMGKTYHLTGKIHVDITKRIPVEAGMAGGSTDCAAAFHAMRELYGLDVTTAELMKLGVTLGCAVLYPGEDRAFRGHRRSADRGCTASGLLCCCGEAEGIGQHKDGI